MELKRLQTGDSLTVSKLKQGEVLPYSVSNENIRQLKFFFILFLSTNYCESIVSIDYWVTNEF